MDLFIERIATRLNEMFIGQWEVDRVEIIKEDIDYYNNYYLKGIDHPNYMVN